MTGEIGLSCDLISVFVLFFFRVISADPAGLFKATVLSSYCSGRNTSAKPKMKRCFVDLYIGKIAECDWEGN